MRVQYLGLPLGALTLLDAGAQFSAVVVGSRTAPGLRRLRRHLSRETLLLAGAQLTDRRIQRILASARPDVGLSWFWPRQVPAPLLHALPRGCYGVHPSLLPRWRGPDPTFWAVAAGDTETGVSLHRLDANFDTGPLVRSVRLPIRSWDTGWSLARRLDRPGLALLREAHQMLLSGTFLPEQRQQEAFACDAPHPDEDQLTVRWNRPSDQIIRLIRAAAPAPGASALFESTEVRILQAEEHFAAPRALAVGEAWKASDGIGVITADGAVLVTKVRLEHDGWTLTGPALHQLLSS